MSYFGFIEQEADGAFDGDLRDGEVAIQIFEEFT